MGMEIRSRSSSPAVAEGAITAATQGGAGGGHGGDDRASTMSNNNVTPFPGRKRPTQEQVAAQERERAEHGAREEDKRRLKKQLEQNQPLKAAGSDQRRAKFERSVCSAQEGARPRIEQNPWDTRQKQEGLRDPQGSTSRGNPETFRQTQESHRPIQEYCRVSCKSDGGSWSQS